MHCACVCVCGACNVSHHLIEPSSSTQQLNNKVYSVCANRLLLSLEFAFNWVPRNDFSWVNRNTNQFKQHNKQLILNKRSNALMRLLLPAKCRHSTSVCRVAAYWQTPQCVDRVYFMAAKRDLFLSLFSLVGLVYIVLTVVLNIFLLRLVSRSADIYFLVNLRFVVFDQFGHRDA